MAIKKQVTADDGIVTNYHRIALISVDVNNQTTILVHSYLTEEARQFEKDYAAGLHNDAEQGEVVFPYVDAKYINVPYESDMTAEKAYRTIKSLEEFAGGEDAFDEWNGDGVEYIVGDYISYNNKIYKVLQSHVSQPDWTPDTAVSLFVMRPDPRVDYSEFVQPTGSHDTYMTGDKITYQGKKYESLIDNNAWSPDTYPSGWKLVREASDPTGDPEQDYEEFVQPTGSHDAYAAGDRVIQNGKVYESLINGNVWAPESYASAWKFIEDISSEEPEEPVEEEPTDRDYPDFVQPTGAHDAYSKGDKITYNGIVYESLIDGNTYSPDAYPAGWKLIEE